MTVEHHAPRVGYHSLVRFYPPHEYPMVHGNYFGLPNGDYVMNMWAENLREWARRNPEAETIEITVFTHAGERRALVTDPRLKEWCTAKLHMLGSGWGTVGILKAAHAHLGIPVPADAVCGCEAFDEGPHISGGVEPLDRNNYSAGYGPPYRRCRRCGRRWEASA